MTAILPTERITKQRTMCGVITLIELEDAHQFERQLDRIAREDY